MFKVDQYFDEEIKAIAVDSKAIALDAAEELRDDVLRQIRRNFNNPSAAFAKGVKVYEKKDDDAVYVKLSPILSVHAIPPAPLTKGGSRGDGNPNLWILLPDGAKLGFRRMSKAFNWSTLKRRFGTRLSFVPVNDGTVVLYRSEQGVKPIYKIQSSVTTKQRIEFYEKAEEIAQREGFDYERGNRSVKFTE
jgi:hypothetical protein